jgi:hypothetical protein
VSQPGAAIVLPPRLVAGQPATLAVLDAEGRLAPGVTVDFTGGAHATTDATGRAAFTAPPEPGVLIAWVAGGGTASATVIPAPAAPAESVALDHPPKILLLADPFTLRGTGFRGEAEANRVALGGHTALVLAASPVALVVQAAPAVTPGPAQLDIHVPGRSLSSVKVTLVALEISADKPQLAPRERGALTVRVHGTGQRLELEVRNLTPEKVTLDRGNLHRAISSGGAENIAAVKLRGRREGEFSVSARVVPPASGMPDVEAARLQLLAALPQAPAADASKWRKRVERVIRRLEKQPADYLRARDDLERMLADYPEGEFGRMLEAAWRILIGR